MYWRKFSKPINGRLIYGNRNRISIFEFPKLWLAHEFTRVNFSAHRSQRWFVNSTKIKLIYLKYDRFTTFIWRVWVAVLHLFWFETQKRWYKIFQKTTVYSVVFSLLLIPNFFFMFWIFTDSAMRAFNSSQSFFYSIIHFFFFLFFQQWHSLAQLLTIRLQSSVVSDKIIFCRSPLL